jgi:hypothetical protein
MTIETKPETAGLIAGKAAAASKKTNAAKPKVETRSKTSKVARALRRSSRDSSRAEKLVCRYCGGAMLAAVPASKNATVARRDAGKVRAPGKCGSPKGNLRRA